MSKGAVRREIAEAFAWAYRDRRTGKNRPAWKSAVRILLYAFAFTCLMQTFYKMAQALCIPMMEQDIEWLFLALMGLLSLCASGLTNVFQAYSAIIAFQKNPNEQLLHAKLKANYLMCLIYELVFMLPAVAVHLQYMRPNPLGVVLSLFVPPILGVLVMSSSFLLAWLAAQVCERVKNKHILTAAMSVAFLFGYYFLYDKSQEIYSAVLENAEQVAVWTRRLCYTLYQMGLAAQGSVVAMLVFCASTVLGFYLFVLILCFAGRKIKNG